MDIELQQAVFETKWEDGRLTSLLLPPNGEWVYVLDKYWTIDRCRMIFYKDGVKLNPKPSIIRDENVIAWAPFKEDIEHACEILIRGGNIWLK